MREVARPHARLPRQPGSEPLSGADVDPTTIYDTERTVVRRLVVGGSATVIMKQPLGPEAVQRLHHERAILERLSAVSGVPHLAGDADGDTLALEDLGGRPLAEILHPPGEQPGQRRGPLPAEEAVLLAVQLADILARVHAAGVVHRDLNPANILVDASPAGGSTLSIVDFDLATTSAQVRPAFADARQILGRLPYLAPEQTGRTALRVDQRADLYALGATLYEMLTGWPPFEDADPLRLIGNILTAVPQPVGERVEGIPLAVSQIVARLLEKQPDARYQSATGLAHDLRVVAADPGAGLALGARDFPTVLAPPQRLLGRERELDLLERMLHQACRGDGPPGAQRLLVSGPPGVGKSALIQELRPLVAARGGWFVSGKADQFQQDARCSVFAQAMDALGHQLLTQSEEELAAVRVRLVRTLGDSAGLVAGLVPSLRRLLGVEPENRADGDPVVTRARITQSAPALLAGVAGVDHPVVVLLDDLQWAGARAMETIDALFSDPSLAGVVVIGAYRVEEVDAAHPLRLAMSRWERLGCAPRQLQLGNLPPECTDALVAATLRAPLTESRRLSAALVERTLGNPYDTVEYLNALRDDGVLTLGRAGWSWDEDVVRRHVGAGDVLSVLAQRLDRLPAACRQVLRVMSCLGGEVDVDTLAAACACPADTVRLELVPALQDGLLLAVEEDAGGPVRPARVLRFCHDRMQRAAHDNIPAVGRAEFTLQVARRLVGHGAELEACALFRDLVDVVGPAERPDLVPLFLRAAEAARRTVNPVLVESYLACAATLHDRPGARADDATGLAIDKAWHEVLYELGRASEGDQVYARIEAAVTDPVRLSGAACIQILGMTNRGMLAEALVLGTTLLERLGVPMPDGDLGEQVCVGYDRTEAWIGTVTVSADVARAQVTDPRLAALAQIMATMCPTAYFSDHLLLGWLVTQAQQLWAAHGPQAQLVPVLGHSNAATLGLQVERQLDRRVVHHALGVGEARGYEPMTARTHFLNTVVMAPWFEPLEQVLVEARTAREVLIRNGDVTNGCYTYYPSVFTLMECAVSLDAVEAEIDEAIAMATRLANPTVLGSMLVCRQFVRVLQGRTPSTATFSDEGYDEGGQLSEMLATNPMGVAHLHLFAGLRDLIFDHRDGLTEHVARLPEVLLTVAGTYVTAVGDLVVGLHAAQALHDRQGDPAVRRRVLDGCRSRLARAGEVAGSNFGHLAALLDAEQAGLDHDVPRALEAFDDALRAADEVARPWHQALAYERAAAFLHRLGARRAAVHLLAEARDRYRSFGARAKADRLDRDWPELRRRGRTDAHVASSPQLTSDTVDMLAILAASQAIGSQTDPHQLYSVLVEQLKTLTGAKTVDVAMPGEQGAWTLQTAGSDQHPISVEQAGRAGAFPLSVFRYLLRLGEPLVVADAVHDARFLSDPFFTGMDRCSLLAVPITSGATVRAVLVLTNGDIRGAFNSDAQTTVRLIAGQLAVSIDNAIVYRSLEDKVEARTRDLEAAKRRLEELSLTDALTLTGNRRRFDQAIAEEWQARGPRPLTVMMVDIDRFKAYNDVRGHQAGDECLRRVARGLSSGLRDHDLICRYGGEEFAIIAPGLTATEARLVAERVRQSVAELRLDHPSGAIVTVSLGVATAGAHVPGDADSLVAAADAALYQAKNAGRNRVQVAAVAG